MEKEKWLKFKRNESFYFGWNKNINGIICNENSNKKQTETQQKTNIKNCCPNFSTSIGF